MLVVLEFDKGYTTTIENAYGFYPSDLENDCYFVVTDNGVGKYNNVVSFHVTLEKK